MAIGARPMKRATAAAEREQPDRVDSSTLAAQYVCGGQASFAACATHKLTAASQARARLLRVLGPDVYAPVFRPPIEV